MQNFQPFDLYRMFMGEQSGDPLFLLEVAFRTAVMYLYVLFFARVVGNEPSARSVPSNSLW
jgi:hypothetical protein